ncbi:hypothetical protein RRG08_043887 [Elysia crispata]|uniref:Uncharacterized protein n=1 Tax=Elysia crispata TaxID=231223 RepID=A0AAE1AZD3_9GAST|nr:hypothetical protein RRG08_043887 [Elysia crispata]
MPVRAAVAVTRLIYDLQLVQALTGGSLVLHGADCTLPYVTAIKERHFSLPAAPAVLKRERKSEKRKRWQVAPRWLENGLLENQKREDEETWPRPLPDLLDSDEDDYHDDEIVYAYESPVEEDNCEPDSTTDL